MLEIDYQKEFKKLYLQLESNENQLQHTFVIKEKDLLRLRIKNMLKQIDKILDEYNKGD